MKKTTHIGAWFIGHLLFAAILVVISILVVPPAAYPHLFKCGALEGYMADFSRRSFRYQMSGHDNSIVVVGPSYAVDVGEAEGVHNLALAMADMGHIKNQVARVKPADTPVCLLSIMDFIRQPMSQSHPFNNRLKWFPYVAKGADFSLSGVRPAPEWATREVQDKLEAVRMRLYKKFSDDPAKIDLGPLSEMREINSNTIFVLAPIRLDNDCVTQAHRALEVAFSQSDLQYINLSRLLDDDDFNDRYHFKKKNQELVLAALRREISL